MSPSQSLSPRSPASLETVHNILGSLVARYRQEEVLTTIRQLPAREAKFRPVPAWVTSALAEAYREKGIGELYSHQAITAELVHDGTNVVVVTPTASGKTLCYNLPVLPPRQVQKMLSTQSEQDTSPESGKYGKRIPGSHRFRVLKMMGRYNREE